MKLTAKLLVLLCLLPAVLGAEESSTVQEHLFEPVDESRQRTVPLKVYLSPSPSPSPVILFSHGLGGSRDGNPYLGNHWAAHGYIAVFLQHPGSDAEIWQSVEPSRRMDAMKKAANFQSSLDRYHDVPFVIDQLELWNAEEGHPLYGKLDLEHIGMSGHSFGAVTTQAVMGRKFPGNRDFLEPRIDAFLPLSPSLGQGLSPADTFGHITAPVLCMTGTRDASIITPDTTPESRMKVFAALGKGDKYHLVFKDALHSAFGDSARDQSARIPHHHPAIQKISTRFWDAYLKGDDEAKTWLQSEQPRGDCHLVEGDIWEWK